MSVKATRNKNTIHSVFKRFVSPPTSLSGTAGSNTNGGAGVGVRDAPSESLPCVAEDPLGPASSSPCARSTRRTLRGPSRSRQRHAYVRVCRWAWLVGGGATGTSVLLKLLLPVLDARNTPRLVMRVDVLQRCLAALVRGRGGLIEAELRQALSLLSTYPPHDRHASQHRPASSPRSDPALKSRCRPARAATG